MGSTDSSAKTILAERERSHGNFKDSATLAQALKNKMLQSRNWHCLTEPHKEALHQIATKISRILAGDPKHADSWHDIAGYAELAAQSIDPPLGHAVDPIKDVIDDSDISEALQLLVATVDSGTAA